MTATANYDRHRDGHGSIEDALFLQSRLLAAVGEAVIATELDGTITYWNPAAERLYGWRADEILGRHVIDVVTTEQTATQGLAIMDRLRAGLSWSGEFVVQRRDGSTFLAAVLDTPVLDADGTLVGIIGTSSDVTERRELERFLQRFMNFGTWEIDLATGTTIWSDGLFRLMGFEPGAVESGPATGLGLIHPDDRERVERQLAQVLETLEPTESAHRIVRPDGEVRWVLDRAEVVVSPENVPLKIRGTDLDVTELRRAEARLQASEVRFRAGFERSPIGLVLVTTNGRIIKVNPAMCRLLGRSQSDLLGRSIAELTHPDDVGLARDAVARMIAGRASTYQAEKRYVRPDGQPIWVLLNASLVRDPQGRPDYVFAQVQDITDRRRAEQEARARAAQQAAVAELGRMALAGSTVEELMDDAVTKLTSGLDLGCAAVLVPHDGGGFEVEAVVGCAAPVMRQLGDAQARYTLDVGEAVVVADLGAETRFVAPLIDGRRFASGVSVVITALGRYYGVLSAYDREARRFSFEDVNFVQAIADVIGTAVARRRHDVAEQRANQQERLAAVGQLAAGVAHDFNNIVSAIGLYAELLQAGQGLDDNGREHLGAIRQQVERATSLIWQILDFAHRSPIEWADVNLATFLDTLLPVLRHTLPAEVEVTVHHGHGPHLVRGDPTRLQQIFMNLATNARDAVGDRGELRITLSNGGAPGESVVVPPGPVPGAWVLVEVIDTGCGMAPEVLGRLFEPFFTTKAVGHGTGLGMAQVHGLVGQHGGQIEVDSSVGAGTKVSIWLPAIDSSPRSEPEKAPAAVSDVTGEHLLVVDDDEASRTALGRILESRGYVVAVACGGEEALAYLDQHAASVTAVVSDVMMPVLGGDGLARVVARRWPAIPVVLISGNPMPPSPRSTVAGEPVRLNKPFTSSQLAEALRVAIGGP